MAANPAGAAAPKTFIDSPDIMSANVDAPPSAERAAPDSPVHEAEGADSPAEPGQTPGGEEPPAQDSEAPAEGEPGSTPGEGGEAPPQAGQAPTKKDGVQTRIDELTRERYDADRRARDAERRAQQAEERLRSVSPPPVAPKHPGAAPTLAQFKYDEAAFTKAMNEYNQKLVDYNTAVAFGRRDVEARQAEAQARWTEAVNAHEEREIEAAADYSDYQEVVHNENLSITPNMADAIVDSPVGPHIAYFLGKNPAEALRIAKLNPIRQIAELGRIEANLTAKPLRKNVTKAPEPVTPVGSREVVNKRPEAMSMSEYIAARKSGKIK